MIIHPIVFGCGAQFLKNAIQVSFQQSFAQIDLVVSEKWLLKLIPLFSILAWTLFYSEVEVIGQNFSKGPSKDHSSQVWGRLAQYF